MPFYRVKLTVVGTVEVHGTADNEDDAYNTAAAVARKLADRLDDVDLIDGEVTELDSE